MQHAIGLVETRGLVGLIEATDAMAKAANVTIMKRVGIGGGLVVGVPYLAGYGIAMAVNETSLGSCRHDHQAAGQGQVAIEVVGGHFHRCNRVGDIKDLAPAVRILSLHRNVCVSAGEMGGLG